MSAVPEDLLAQARAARERAYAPYSGFLVGAAIRSSTGKVFAGCNVENAAYPQGWCAEATAIGAMVAAGEREIVEVLVFGDGPQPCTPCGGCRQKLFEFAAAQTPVYVCDPQGEIHRFSVGELLPFAFGPGNLASTRDS